MQKTLRGWEGAGSKGPGLRSWGCWSGQQRYEVSIGKGNDFSVQSPPSPTDVISSDAVQKADNRHWAYSPVCSIWAPKGLYLYPKAFWSIPVPQAGWITVTMEWLVCIMQPLDICKPFEAYLFFKYWSMQANPESHIHMKRNGSWFNEELSLCLSLSLLQAELDWLGIWARADFSLLRNCDQ